MPTKDYIPQAGPEGTEPDGVYFAGFVDGKRKQYPAWRYHKMLSPLIVQDTAEDEKAKGQGYEPQWAPLMANKELSNWYWDLEDMSPRQLVVFAKEEFGVDLPVDGRQEKLLEAVLELTRWAPQNRGRIVLMAHSIKMNYDETLLEIRKLADNPMSEVETKEITI